MRVLGIETSTLVSRVALFDGERLVGEETAPAQPHSEALVPLIDGLVRRAGLAPQDLELMAVSIGPGSFTGLRIGLATAKGLAFALGRPLVTVSSMAALAHAAGLPRVITAVDARRGEVFGARYDVADDRAVAVLADGLFTAGAFAAALGEHASLPAVGDGVHLIPGLGPFDPTIVPRAASVARLGLARWRDRPIDEVASAEPAYLRLAAPEEKLAQPSPDHSRERPEAPE
jgi:tRNA threonylcarbamoyladenosine biosynthesis protein TsaB